MPDVLFLIPPPPSNPGAVLRGAGRHVWVKGSTPGARHRPGRWWRQLLRHREVGTCNNLLTKWWTLFHHRLWSAEPFEDGQLKLCHGLPMNPFTCRMSKQKFLEHSLTFRALSCPCTNVFETCCSHQTDICKKTIHFRWGQTLHLLFLYCFQLTVWQKRLANYQNLIY